MANLDEFRVDIVPGAGLVARFPRAIVVVPSFEASQREAVEGLVEICRSATGESIARSLGEKVVSTPQGLPGFAALAQAGDRLNLFVHGSAEASGSASEGPFSFSGADAATWVDRVLEGVESIRFGSPGSMPSEPGGLFDLSQGVVPGAGALLSLGAPVPSPAPRQPGPRRRTQPVEPQPEQASEDSGIPVESSNAAVGAETDLYPRAPVDVSPHRESKPESPAPPAADTSRRRRSSAESAAPADGKRAERTPSAPDGGAEAPVEPQPAAPSEVPEKQPALVKGVICPGPGRHFNHPDALNCWQDGLSMVHITRLLIDGPRPSLGTLVLDDGSAQDVDSDFIVGRQPDDHPLVQSGDARPFRLSDPQRLVSSKHAAIKLVGWEVYVEDLESRNGTFAVTPDGTETRIGSSPALIESGSSVRIGNRRLTYHSHHRVK